MTAVSGIDHTFKANPRTGGISDPHFSPPSIDSKAPGTRKSKQASGGQLPPSSGNTDNKSAYTAISAISQNVGIDYARIAALMLLIDSELARASKDARVIEIESIAQQLHGIADKIRTSAKLALAGGIVSGGLSIVSAGVSMAGGLYGASLTKAPTTTGKTNPVTQAPGPEPAPITPQPQGQPQTQTSHAGGSADAPEVQTLSDAPDTQVTPDGSGSQVSDAELPPAADAEALPAADAEAPPAADAEAPPRTDAEAADKILDHTLSQQLSARSQSVILVTQGLSLMVNSGGEISKSTLDFRARMEEADVKDEEAEVEQQRSYMENTRAFAESMQKSAHDMLQIVQQMYDGINQTSRSIWSRV